MVFSDVKDKLLDKDSLSDTSTGEQTGLATFSQRSDQVDDLDAGFKDFSLVRLFSKRRWLAVDWRSLTSWRRFAVFIGPSSSGWFLHMKHSWGSTLLKTCRAESDD